MGASRAACMSSAVSHLEGGDFLGQFFLDVGRVGRRSVERALAEDIGL